MTELTAAIDLSKEDTPVFLATSEAGGQPHIMYGGTLEQMDPNHVTLEGWLCLITRQNIESNPYVSLVVRDQSGTRGFQLTGAVEDVAELAVLNGYAPAMQEGVLPKTERKLVIRIDKVLDFSRGPHTDEPAK